ncbi:hypothetical protein MSAN_01190100 [Mycena sanguinolenta]|uniref:Uncharacterized protein n=1 Tax=Mycena sanguinolenta TaxID=230812 RepID=A0A8H6YM46_9AGAR|nr:hypothetical protein MSAN_01190100 [Mycena sanguinolenta]
MFHRLFLTSCPTRCPPTEIAANSGYKWTKEESANHAPYETGVKMFEGDSKDMSAEANSNLNWIDIPVDWEVTGATWKDTNGDIRSYITSYSLHVAHGNPIFDWRLEFRNAQNKKFQFFDRTNDGYKVDCYMLGTHLVNYNSNKPEIKMVRIWL